MTQEEFNAKYTKRDKLSLDEIKYFIVEVANKVIKEYEHADYYEGCSGIIREAITLLDARQAESDKIPNLLDVTEYSYGGMEYRFDNGASVIIDENGIINEYTREGT